MGIAYNPRLLPGSNRSRSPFVQRKHPLFPPSPLPPESLSPANHVVEICRTLELSSFSSHFHTTSIESRHTQFNKLNGIPTHTTLLRSVKPEQASPANPDQNRTMAHQRFVGSGLVAYETNNMADERRGRCRGYYFLSFSILTSSSAHGLG